MRELAIIILQHNTPEHVERNLMALQAANLPQDTEIIVVNNGGHGANERIAAASYSNLQVKFFETANDGFPKGNNFGLAQTEGKYYAFINPDIIVRPDTIEQMLNYLKSNTKVGIVAPQLIYPDGQLQDSFRTFPRLPDLFIKRIPWLRKLFPKRMFNYLMWGKNVEQSEAIDWAVGAFIIVTSDCMQAIGKHDDSYFLFMSDVVICRDAWERGFEVHYVAEAKATHNDKRVSDGSFLDYFRKKTIRIHVKDAIKYFWHYLFKSLPAGSPSGKK